MTNSPSVRVGPQLYQMKEGILEFLPTYLAEQKYHRVLVVHGIKSYEKALPYLQSFLEADLERIDYIFQGECSEKAIQTLIQTIQDSNVDAVVALGGGKVMDASKQAAYRAGAVPVLAIPTLASNCAPWTSVSVVYNEERMFERLDILPSQFAALFIEPRIIFEAPIEYFIAGMGDTLAKWYESDAILSKEEHSKPPMLRLARLAAKECQETILERGPRAVESQKQGILSDDFLAVIETIIVTSGLVGGFGDALARATIAHEIHDSLTMYPEVHTFLHGSIVGYGILVQLAMEGKWNEIERLKAFYRPLEIPVSLKEMGMDFLTEQQKEEMAQIITTRPHLPIHDLPYEVSIRTIVDAMNNLEKTETTTPTF